MDGQCEQWGVGVNGCVDNGRISDGWKGRAVEQSLLIYSGGKSSRLLGVMEANDVRSGTWIGFQ